MALSISGFELETAPRVSTTCPCPCICEALIMFAIDKQIQAKPAMEIILGTIGLAFVNRSHQPGSRRGLKSVSYIIT